MYRQLGPPEVRHDCEGVGAAAISCHVYEIAFTLPHNMSGLPASSSDRGLNADGRPIELQISRRRFADLETLHALLVGHLAFTDPDNPATRPNQKRPLFLDRHTRELTRDWAHEAASAVASVRYVVGQYPDDRALAELVGELSLSSREFARLWGKHDVRSCSSGTKRLHHPQVGDLDLHYQVLHLPDSNGLRLLTHTAAARSAAADAVALLGCRREAADWMPIPMRKARVAVAAIVERPTMSEY